jgi:hypothetical protein
MGVVSGTPGQAMCIPGGMVVVGDGGALVVDVVLEGGEVVEEGAVVDGSVVVGASVVAGTVVVGTATISGMWITHPVRGCDEFEVDAARSLASCRVSADTPWA